MNLLKVVIIADSVVAVLKLVFAIILIVHAVKRKLEFDRSEKFDSYALAELAIMLLFIVSTTFLISILLRLVANYCQYRNQQFGCCRCLCFAQYIIGIVIILFILLGTLIFGDGITGTLAFIFLCWDVIIPCVLFQSFMSKATYPHVVQYEQRNSKEDKVHEGNEKLNENCTVEIQQT